MKIFSGINTLTTTDYKVNVITNSIEGNVIRHKKEFLYVLEETFGKHLEIFVKNTKLR